MGRDSNSAISALCFDKILTCLVLCTDGRVRLEHRRDRAPGINDPVVEAPAQSNSAYDYFTVSFPAVRSHEQTSLSAGGDESGRLAP